MPSVRSRPPEPFRAVLRRLRQERDLSLESLGYEIRDQGPGVSLSLLGMLERGQRQPKATHMELIAAALKVEPEVFAEYRLALVRRLFDERQVGLEEAVRNLAALLEAGDAVADRVGEEIERLAQDPEPSDQGAASTRSRPAGRRRKSA